jgi:hypothetical protein
MIILQNNIEIPSDEEKFVFSEVQIAKILNALHQIEMGEYLTSEAANDEIEAWLKK